LLHSLTATMYSSLFAFLYPGYASYKTLSQRPAAEEELERWLMYWSVLGCILSVEYVAEWAISWFPFYYPAKTLFLLYLALPQTKGSSYFYVNHLQPFFHSHESQIDATLASLKTRVYTFLQEQFRALWAMIATALGIPQQSTVPAPDEPPPPPGGVAQIATSLWQSFGPSIVATGAALLRQGANAPTVSSTSRPAATHPRQSSAQLVEERRRQLEAELAALDAGSVPMPSASPSLETPGSGEGHLRDRTGSQSRFEEIEVPSDVEGYDVDSGVGHALPQQRRSSSWFGWGSNQAGYERLKND
ncbi:hypothetical protein FISHEDRAFT_40649, partial [Fistulina hepatica ATCC 64428]